MPETTGETKYIGRCTTCGGTQHTEPKDGRCPVEMDRGKKGKRGRICGGLMEVRIRCPRCQDDYWPSEGHKPESCIATLAQQADVQGRQLEDAKKALAALVEERDRLQAAQATRSLTDGELVALTVIGFTEDPMRGLCAPSPFGFVRCVDRGGDPYKDDNRRTRARKRVVAEFERRGLL